ncbi:MAG: RNA-binding protein [Flavobacterium sp.]|nr:MAG: RNA-binding protein [Flavobacterium sp.]
MAKREHKESPISEVLKGFIKTNKLQKGLDKVSAEEAWHKVMGNAISKYTTAIKLDREILYVQLSSSVLRDELSYGKTKIISLLNEEMGKQVVTKLVLR